MTYALGATVEYKFGSQHVRPDEDWSYGHYRGVIVASFSFIETGTIVPWGFESTNPTGSRNSTPRVDEFPEGHVHHVYLALPRDYVGIDSASKCRFHRYYYRQEDAPLFYRTDYKNIQRGRYQYAPYNPIEAGDYDDHLQLHVLCDARLEYRSTQSGVALTQYYPETRSLKCVGGVKVLMSQGPDAAMGGHIIYMRFHSNYTHQIGFVACVHTQPEAPGEWFLRTAVRHWGTTYREARIKLPLRSTTVYHRAQQQERLTWTCTPHND